MKKIYETIVICDPTLQADALNSYAMELKRTFQTYSNKYIVKFDDLGERKLAYELKSYKTGHYLYYVWEGKDADPLTMEGSLRKSPNVLKFLTVTIDGITLQPIVDVLPLINQY